MEFSERNSEEFRDHWRGVYYIASVHDVCTMYTVHLLVYHASLWLRTKNYSLHLSKLLKEY